VPALTVFIDGNPFERIRAVDLNAESAPFGGSIRALGLAFVGEMSWERLSARLRFTIGGYG
jgi:hypothetical protein